MVLIFRVFVNNNLQSIFPNIYIFLKICLTLPIGSVATERSFSKLKIIKNLLRSTMANTRLERFMTISCENDIEINYDEVIDIFCKTSQHIFNALN